MCPWYSHATTRTTLSSFVALERKGHLALSLTLALLVAQKAEGPMKGGKHRSEDTPHATPHHTPHVVWKITCTNESRHPYACQWTSYLYTYLNLISFSPHEREKVNNLPSLPLLFLCCKYCLSGRRHCPSTGQAVIMLQYRQLSCSGRLRQND